MGRMRVAVVQFVAGDDKPANLVRLRDLIGKAAAEGAELVVAPEASMHGFGEPDTPLAPVAESLDGPFVSELADVARAHRITVVAGMFESVEGDGSRAYN